MTYEGAHSVIGPLLKDLGATATEVGIIAGLGEMIAASLRYFSGKLADRTRAYWTITTLGYFLNLVVVPGLAFAGNWQAAALLVVAERTGKSLRGPARDVLLSEATEVVGYGKGFGLHAAMDQTGAVVGPVFVAISVARTHHFNQAFLWLSVPAAAAFVSLLFARWARGDKGKPPQLPVAQRDFPKVFWFLGSVTMGALYDFSLVALVVFGVSAQLAAAVLFIWLRRPLAKEKAIA